MKSKVKKMEYTWSLKKPMYMDKKDKRFAKHMKQIKSVGFSDSETWSLYSNISMFILPRLIRFKEVNIGYPMNFTPKQWDEILDDIIFAFEWTLIEDEHTDDMKMWRLNWKRADKGFKLFGKYFMHLWW